MPVLPGRWYHKCHGQAFLSYGLVVFFSHSFTQIFRIRFVLQIIEEERVTSLTAKGLSHV